MTALLAAMLAAAPALFSIPSANLTLLPLSTGVAALDGSPYGFYLVPYEGDVAAHKHRWTISLEGGGWCVGLEDCYSRSRGRTMHGHPGSLGSSLPYVGQRHGCDCMNTNGTDVTDHGCNCINLLYLDGASFSGNAAEPFPVPGRPGTFLHYRGPSKYITILGGFQGPYQTRMRHSACYYTVFKPVSADAGAPHCGSHCHHQPAPSRFSFQFLWQASATWTPRSTTPSRTAWTRPASWW